MRLNIGQQMRMSQQMKLSPRMIQSMEILQLPALALEERIEQEMEINPTLEMVEIEPDENSPSNDTQTDKDTDNKPMVVEDSESGQADDFKRLDDMSNSYGSDWEDNFNSSSEYRPRQSATGERDSKMDAMSNTAARSASLGEQLMDQWRFAEVSPTLFKAGEILIQFFDDDGYFRVDFDQVLNQTPMNITRADLEQALTELQNRLEPTGLGARNLAECLTLQIDTLLCEAVEDNDIDELEYARTLVCEHMKDIEMNRLPRIASRSGLSIPQIKAAMERLRRLDPKPGKQLAPDQPQIIIPDITVEYDPINDQYVAGLNRGRQPALRVSPQYRELSKDRTQEKETRKYLAGNMQNARWLIDSIEQRNSTLLRVVRAVIDHQRDFFDAGAEQLKPLPMIHVADQLGIHVGTVSRAVSEKYMQTPRGIFPLRMFFSGGTESASGQEMSWGAVQAKLKQIIDDEDKSKPMNDDQLAEEMTKIGLEIKRRTVAKYRSQLNIPTARKRKQF